MPEQAKARIASVDPIKTLNLSDRASAIQQGKQGKGFDRKKITWLRDTYFGHSKNFMNVYFAALGIDQAKAELLIGAPGTIKQPQQFLWLNKPEQFELPAETNQDELSILEILCRDLVFPSLKSVAEAIRDAADFNSEINIDNLMRDYSNYFYRRVGKNLTPAIIVETRLHSMRQKIAATPISFIDSINSEAGRSGFWSKYPVLWRLASTISKLTTDACIETITRIVNDRSDIKLAFGIDTKLELTSIEWGTGDAHKQGRVVAILNFEGEKLVYKPRSMAIDVAYKAFLDWLRTVDESAPASITALDCQTHGYAEFIQAGSCQTPEELKVFYTKMGALTAVSWLLGITDLHHENIIASEVNPHIVDIETTLDRPIKHLKGNLEINDHYSQAERDLVLRTGLLPRRQKVEKGIFDISAIGARADQFAPVDIMTVENFGEDNARIISKPGEITVQQNNPAPLDSAFRPHHFVDQIAYGFAKTIDAFVTHRDFLSGDKSPLKQFENVTVRWVARPTMDYCVLLEKITHTTIITDAMNCDMLIGGTLCGLPHYAENSPGLIKSESRDIWNGDVPYFWTKAGSRDLFDSFGNAHKDFFECDGLTCLKERLASVGKSKEAQLNAIRLSVLSTAELESLPAPKAAQERIHSSDLVTYAMNIGDDLIEKAHYIGDMPFWVGLTPLDDSNYSTGILPANLYDGAAGIGLFLAYLYKHTGEKKYKAQADKIHKHLLELLRTKMALFCAGAYSGLASLLYADMHLSKILDKPVSRETRAAFLDLAKLAKYDQNFDIISGAAGALIVALRYHAYAGIPEALKAAKAAAQRLQETAKPQKVGTAWETVKERELSAPLGGLSHGATGIAWALSEWANYTKQAKWTKLARSAFAYEQTLYDAKAKSWLDTRTNTHSCYWCYGAPGIGLATQRMKGVLNADAVSLTLKRAKASTWKEGASSNQCLCHGSIGNAELFRSLGDNQKADAFVSAAVQSYQTFGKWDCGMPGGAVSPGLMTGLAGIGMGLVRHVFPDDTPNILSLDGPIVRR